MTGAAGVIPAALVAIALAMLLVRLGWGGRRNAAVLGWSLGVGGLIVLAMEDGAWGLALGIVVAMAAASGFVLHAGWTAPVRLRRAVREAPSITLPHRPGELARRLAVFVLVVPVAFVAAEWLAFGMQAVVRARGAAAADTTVLALLGQPLIWTGLMAWQMTRTGPANMVAAPAGVAVIGTLLWSMA